MAPHKGGKAGTSSETRLGEDVIVYDGGIKNVHQDFVIVFAITFAVIVVVVVTAVCIFHIIKKCTRTLEVTKSNPSLYITTEGGTVIYEKEPIVANNMDETSYMDIDEVSQISSELLTSRERRKRFAENRSKTSQVSSSHLGSIEETCSHHSKDQGFRGSRDSKDQAKGSYDKAIRHLGMSVSDRSQLQLPLENVHGTGRHGSRRHTCTLACQREQNSFDKKIQIIKQQSLQY